MTIKLIVGLQNPGATYKDTRHNVGGWCVHTLATLTHAKFTENKKFTSLIADIEISSTECKLILPLTFMNQCGRPIRDICSFYHFTPQEMLIVHDDLDLPVGKLKLKLGGGHGGHNGLRDIIEHVGKNDFYRLRIGIGHPGIKHLVTDYVLGKPTLEDRTKINMAIAEVVAKLPLLLKENMSEAMMVINTTNLSKL